MGAGRLLLDECQVASPGDGRPIELYTVDAEWPAALGDAPNPYVAGNETVFAQFPRASGASVGGAAGRAARRPRLGDRGGQRRHLALYRPDKQTSSGLGFDGATLDDCADTYISTMQSYDASKDACEPHGVPPPVGNFSLVLRAKLPRVLVASDAAPPDATFGEYDARYFSVGSHICGAYEQDDDAELAWWTVNARMLAASADGDGVGTVFFVPRDDARALQAAQGRDAWDAPELAWGDALAGRVLGTPRPRRHAVSEVSARAPTQTAARCRRRARREGSPSNAPCYANPVENRPLEADGLGEYTPEIYGVQQIRLAERRERGHIPRRAELRSAEEARRRSEARCGVSARARSSRHRRRRAPARRPAKASSSLVFYCGYALKPRTHAQEKDDAYSFFAKIVGAICGPTRPTRRL